jgi:hypothetical protein
MEELYAEGVATHGGPESCVPFDGESEQSDRQPTRRKYGKSER